ncbi:MAG: thioether cross-link-forming SCIFF peptide maturase [Clostridia bacterium]|nr:thioether cross-link-forming SCIFF peptide maturase [Clostridia bacterium]
MVHLIEFNGKYAALDVESGAVHAIDRDAMRVLSFMNAGKSDEQIIADLGEDVREALEEIHELIDAGLLYTEPADAEDGPKFNEPVVKALCLLVAQDCNLRCDYCFAEGGEYHRGRSVMSEETAKAALDFLVASSGNRRQLEVDFFGGEPLLNFDVVRETVAYGRELEKKHDKIFRFTLTTNAYHVTDEMIDFINREMKNVVISIDGREEVHDARRRSAGGAPTWKKVVENARRIVAGRQDKEYYIRGTYTADNLDFSNDVLAIVDLGFDQVSVEPVVLSGGDLSIRLDHVPILKHEYDVLAREILKREKQGDAFNFFHFMIDLDSGPCINKRLRGCGAGSEYLAVTADGSLYPCHQFAGNEKFRMGSVFGPEEPDAQIRSAFESTHVFSKKGCSSCWAKYYCSGGCAANAYMANGNIRVPYDVGCETEKRRLETAIAMKTYREEFDDDKEA